MEEERKYLSKVINRLAEDVQNYNIEIPKLQAQRKLSKDQITDNFYDMDSEELSRLKVEIDEADKTISVIEKALKKAEKQLDKPYFGRIDFVSNGKCKPIYIGLGMVKDKDMLVYDWRAPISSMYYDFELGNADYQSPEGKIEGEITLKRQYVIEEGNLKFFIDTAETINDEILKLELSKNSSAKMKQIVATIQKEQNSLIRGDEYKNMLVQGVAGSGKTSVALHRASYLLYKHKEDFTSQDILILSPSNLFSTYISEVLPELGDDNVIETTFFNIAKIELGKKLQTKELMLEEIFENPTNARLNEIAYKASFAFLEDLKEFLSSTFLRAFRPATLSFKSSPSAEPSFVFTKEEMEKLYYESYSNLDLQKRIDYIADYLIERLNLKKNEFLPIKNRFKGMLYKFFPISDIREILNLFFSAKGIEIDTGEVVRYDDIAALLLIKEYVYGLDNKYSAKYVIIDEMQDFTPVHFYIFNKLWDCNKLLLGDIHQCIEKNLTEEYLLNLADFMDTKLISLNKAYRSTKEISSFCQNLIGLKNVESISRSGQKPSIIKTEDVASEIKTLVYPNLNKYKHIAIICKTKREVDSLYSHLRSDLPVHKVGELDASSDYNLIITTATTSKGIEFDQVIIPNVDKQNYSNLLDRNLLYVACTRALHKLDLIYCGKPSSFLN